MPTAKRYATFHDFYPFYLSEHANRVCRRLHFVGTSLGLMCLVTAVITRNAWWIVVKPARDLHVPALLVHRRLGDVARQPHAQDQVLDVTHRAASDARRAA